MKKSETLLKKLQKAQYLLEQVDSLQQEVFAEAGESTTGDYCFDIHCGIEEMISQLDDVAYQIVSPIQMREEEEAKKLELLKLKARVAELENELCYGE
jgi:hypothetical protein